MLPRTSSRLQWNRVGKGENLPTSTGILTNVEGVAVTLPIDNAVGDASEGNTVNRDEYGIGGTGSRRTPPNEGDSGHDNDLIGR